MSENCFLVCFYRNAYSVCCFWTSSELAYLIKSKLFILQLSIYLLWLAGKQMNNVAPLIKNVYFNNSKTFSCIQLLEKQRSISVGWLGCNLHMHVCYLCSARIWNHKKYYIIFLFCWATKIATKGKYHLIIKYANNMYEIS